MRDLTNSSKVKPLNMLQPSTAIANKNSVAEIQSPDIKYNMIRQPYRITMARWNYTAIEKRILTTIIYHLQKVIASVEKGVPFGQLELFDNNGSDTVKIVIPTAELVVNSNNYKHVKAALNNLRAVDVEINMIVPENGKAKKATRREIILPATKGRVSKKPEEVTILTGLIERAEIKKHARQITITIHQATARELVKTSAGLTSFAKEVMFLTDNSYTQKIYEMISHWKDKEVISYGIQEFKELLSITHKYPNTADIIRFILEPAQKELKIIAPMYFEFSTTKTGKKITKFNLVIKNKKMLELTQDEKEQNIDYLKQIMRLNSGFKNEHFAEIKEIIENPQITSQILDKLYSIDLAVKRAATSPETAIKRIPEYFIASLKKEFGK